MGGDPAALSDLSGGFPGAAAAASAPAASTPVLFSAKPAEAVSD